MNQVWTPLEEEFVKKNSRNLTDEVGAAQLSQIVGRLITTSAWRKKRQQLGIKKAPGRGICKLAGE